ncbi:MAG: hypothetical protein AAF447_22540 [Myxococcota bacterium]
MSANGDTSRGDASTRPAPTLRQVARDTFRLLTFRLDGHAQRTLGPRHLAFGLFWTWLVGMGRWWDDPTAHVTQHLGVGSVVYVFVLSLVLFVVFVPLARERMPRLRSFIAFVALTSPPAMFYAIPVERFLPASTAATANVVFLLIVAVWRVALLVRYVRVGLGLGGFATTVATLLPLSAIVSFVSVVLKMGDVLVQSMGGLRDQTQAERISTAVVSVLSCLGPVVFLFTVASYADLMRKARQPGTDAPAPTPGPDDTFHS